MSARYFLLVVGAFAFVTGTSFANFWQPVIPLTTPGPQYYKKFEAVPPVEETAEKFATNFLRINIPVRRDIVKRQAPPRVEDIVIVMDGSGSVGSCEFDKGRKALKAMIDLVITDTKYAAVTFESTSQVNFNFLTRDFAASKILTIPYPSGGTNTQAGLNDAMKLFKSDTSGRRDFSHKIVLLVTDGQSNVDKNLTIPTANALKSIGVKIFMVATGDYISGLEELVNVASYPPEDHLFRTSSLNGFYQVVKLVLKKVDPTKFEIVAGQDEPPCP